MDNGLREAIRKSGLSANALSGETGVPQPTISRFLAGADIRMKNAAKIASYLGLRLKKEIKKRKVER